MKLTWYGHSCFSLKCQDGIIVFDPFSDGSVPGLKKLSLQANLVLCSHEHSDHNARNVVSMLEHKNIKVDYIDTYHDDQKGKLRGKNRIYIVESEGMKVVHFGDLGCLFSELNKIQNCDVLMIPIGGYYTIDSQQALTLIEHICPRIVIPMHYSSDTFGYDEIDRIDFFVNHSKNVIKYDTNQIEITKDTRQQTAVLKYL